MAKPVIIPNTLSAAPGTRITCVATGDITPAYWRDRGDSNAMLPQVDGRLTASPLVTGSTGKEMWLAQKIPSSGGGVQYPIHNSQVTTPGLVTNHLTFVNQLTLVDATGRIVIGWNTWVNASGWYVDIFNHTQFLGRHTQSTSLTADKIIEISFDAGYCYGFYDGNFIYGGAHAVAPVFPVAARFVCTWGGPGQPATATGGDVVFNNPTLTGNWALIHLPASQNMSLNCYDAAGGLVSDAEHTATLNSRAWAQQASGAPEMKFTMPAGVTVKKIRVYYNANSIQTLAQSTHVEIAVTGGTAAPLQITAPAPPSTTLQPGQSVAIVCNYPSSEITYAAGGGGGSFSGSVYTASQNAGEYFIHVHRGADDALLYITVPAKLTPASASLIGSTAQNFTINADVTNFATTGWTADGGTLSAKAVRGVTYTAPTSVGTYHLYAQTALGQLVANVTVTASGGTAVTGFRLLPEAGYAVQVGAQVTVSAVTDKNPLVWATLENLRIDGASNNVIIQDNAAIARAVIANALGTEGGTFEWTLGPYLVPNSTADTHRLSWGFHGASAGLSQTPVAEMIFRLNLGLVGIADFVTVRNSLVRTTTNIQVDAETAFRLVIPNPQSGTWEVWLKPNSTYPGGFQLVDSFAGPGEPRYVKCTYLPRLQSYPSNQTPIAWPVLTGRWERFYPPNWSALLLNAQGQTIGSLPVQAIEAPGASGPDSTFPQQAIVTASAAGSGRVTASYPSGQTASNVVPITISQTSAALDVIFPETSPFVMDPNQAITVESNYAKEVLSYFTSGGGAFGITPETKNVYTAFNRAGSGPYFEVRKGTETVRIFVVVRAKLEPTSQFAAPGATVYLTLNTDSAGVTVGATGGTVSLGAFLGNYTRQIIYTAPLTAGTFTITADTPAGSAQATVTVQTQAAISIANENADVEPGSQTLIVTNYPAAEVTFSVSPNAGSFAGAVWTAPQTAGRYTITASRSGAGSDTVLLVVPLRIAPKNPASIGQGAQIQFSANFTPVAWSVAPGNGAITSSGLYTAPLSSGQYGVSVSATVGGVGNSDTALVTVSGAALAVQGPTSVTIQPGQQYRILVNYPLSEVNFNTTPPGAFGLGADENLYTAPNDAGTYTAQVARGNEVVTVTFTVPVVLTPAAITLGNGEIQVFSVNADVTAFATTGWSATGGTLTSKAIRTVQYNAGTTAGTYGITAITNKGTISAIITQTGAAGGGLSITYPADPITLNPGSSITLGFNIPYEPAIALSATGGTFSGATYTAPQTAGTYTITATREGQTDTLTVKIPLVVAPSAVVSGPGARTLLTVNHPSPVFTVAVGAGTMDGNTFVASNTVATYSQGIIVTAIGLTVVVPVVIQSTQLVVYGPSTITLGSNDPYLVSSNVPPNAATYTAFGGHFEGNTYVAPAVAGNYYFTVSYEGQSARVDVRVPLEITPDVARLEFGQTQQFSVNATSATWSASGGTINASTGFFTAPTSGTVITITATTPTGSDTAQVLLLEEFPYQPNYAVEGELGRTIVLVEAEDGGRFGRAKGHTRRSYSLKFQNRDKDEVLAALEFWSARYPEQPFLWSDLKLGDFTAVVFDSAIRWEVSGTCLFAYSFRIVEV